jgi:hypothetical protein
VAAVLASVEDCAAGRLRQELSRSEFRELVQERRRSCDAALLELTRAAIERDEAAIGAVAGVDAPSWRRRITGRGIPIEAAIALDELRMENARLRRLLTDQRAEIESLRRLSRPRGG